MKIIKPLTVKEIDSTKATDKEIRLRDGQGLFLSITATSKIWRFDYIKLTGKRTTISIGKYPAVSLAMARAKRDEYLSLLARNIDPKDHELQQKKSRTINTTFLSISKEWLEQTQYQPKTKNRANYYIQLACQFFGKKSVMDIVVFDVLDCLEAISKQHTPLIADRTKNKIAQVLDYALAKRLISHNPARSLIRTYQKHKSSHHHATTDPRVFQKIIQDIHTEQNIFNKNLLLMACYLFVRPSELVSMNINDINLDTWTWSYTPQKTKNSTQTQIVTALPRQAIDIIKQMQAIYGTAYIFPARRRGKIPHTSKENISDWFKEHGYQGIQTAHGLRATARTILEEVMEYDPKYIEMQLGHQVKDPNGTAYNRAKYLKQRTEMMQKWADFIDELKKDEKNT